MRLLIFTQVLDTSHSDLGFFHAWVAEFAKKCDKVIVVCLFKGEHDLPDNVEVLSLGKEKGVSRLKYILHFYSYLFRRHGAYDAVLVHMNPEYVLLAGLWWRLMHKPVGLWYVHKHVGWRLKSAAILVNHIFTVSPESFRLQSSKVKILGHGIDAAHFARVQSEKKSGSDRKRILMLGRVSTSKRLDVGIELMKYFAEENKGYELVIVGEPMGEKDKETLLSLERVVEEYGLEDVVSFAGAVRHSETREHYHRADVFLHASETGSVDKVVLEALAAGLPVVSTSEAFTNTPGVVSVKPGEVSELASALEYALNNETSSVGVEYVRTSHSLERLIGQIVSYLSGDTLSR